MQIIRQLSALRERTKLIRESGRTLALVPTMGALHAGHMSLVELARRQADDVIVSIFVNPKQFGPNEDLDKYPRSEEADAARLAEAGVTALWMPSVSEVYPDGFATSVKVANLGELWCGAARPGHFEGVATVVAKLFNQVRPDIAVFGEKDWQQLAIIRRMARDLDLDVEIIGMPIVRDTDGLALSSRNAYLSSADRQAALTLPRALNDAARDIGNGADVEATLADAKARLLAAGFTQVDYFALVDAATLEPLATHDRTGRLLAAARIGATRLIDNIAL
ncbi:pantoate--beta-alanine ligase [Aquisediminimonas profunda]|uniref:pantoate--beta-alanine ligase n=1 Tax=Aquisediminimonas profunda TaxID=1550733 RepID=UPI001C6379AC|nr:pantoate--beta-alanine ligase [Aquisediminimonas profunda]